MAINDFKVTKLTINQDNSSFLKTRTSLQGVADKYSTPHNKLFADIVCSERAVSKPTCLPFISLTLQTPLKAPTPNSAPWTTYLKVWGKNPGALERKTSAPPAIESGSLTLAAPCFITSNITRGCLTGRADSLSKHFPVYALRGTYFINKNIPWDDLWKCV